MNNHRQFLPSLILTLALCFPLLSNGHEDHDHEAEKAAAMEQTAYFTTETSSALHEVLLRYAPIHPGEETTMTLFLSAYASNQPLDGAKISIQAREDATLTFTIKQTEEGQYSVSGVFPRKQEYSLSVNVQSPQGNETLLLEHLEAGKIPEHIAEAPHTHLFTWKNILLMLGSLGIGLFIGILIQKRNTKNGKQLISIMLMLVYSAYPVTSIHAHEDHDPKPFKKKSPDFSNSFHVPKETQFLFDIYTEKIQRGGFTASTKLFGTVIPSSNGQAIVSVPQNGRVISLHTRVGEQVKSGQLLAVVEQHIDAVSQVNILAEKNTLIAELEAAQKEMGRLNAIKDIAAKKDLDEAAARLKKAESNLQLFNSNTGKTISLYAPVKGTIGTFQLSIGATVNAGQTLFTITDLNSVYVEAQVFDKDADKIQRGTRFTVECSNDNHKTSEVQLLSQAKEINPTNQSQRVLFQLSNPDNDFKIGEFVDVRVFEPGNTSEIVLPNSAFTEINGKPVVFIKGAAEKYSLSYVQTGTNNGSFTTILKGVEEGERVVVNGSYQLKMIYLNQ